MSCQAYEKEISDLKGQLKEVRDNAERDAADAKRIQQDYEDRIKEKEALIQDLGKNVENFKATLGELEK